MDKTGGRPVLNNKELARRALDTVQRPMQDYVISEMKFKFGQSWWKDGVLPNRYRFGIPDYAPDSEDATDDAVRSFMDVTLCLNLISEHKLLPVGLHREARDPLSYVRDLRNNVSHFGDSDYTEAQAQNAISTVIVLDEIMEFGCRDELSKLMRATIIPIQNSDDNAESEPVPLEEPIQKEPAVRNNGIQCGTPAPVSPREPGQRCDQVDACILASRGMFGKLQSKQQTDRWDTSRLPPRLPSASRKVTTTSSPWTGR